LFNELEKEKTAIQTSFATREDDAARLEKVKGERGKVRVRGEKA
jgi:hypothetical protein